MKQILPYFITFCIAFMLGCTVNCGGKKTVTTPEIKGTFHDTIKVTQTRFVPKTETITKHIPYEVVKRDTVVLQGDTIRIEPIDTLRTETFSKTQENKFLKITMYGIVTGKINDIKADYVIKPQEVKVPKASRIGIGISVGVGVDGKPYAGAGINYNIIGL